MSDVIVDGVIVGRLTDDPDRFGLLYTPRELTSGELSRLSAAFDSDDARHHRWVLAVEAAELEHLERRAFVQTLHAILLMKIIPVYMFGEGAFNFRISIDERRHVDIWYDLPLKNVAFVHSVVI